MFTTKLSFSTDYLFIDHTWNNTSFVVHPDCKGLLCSGDRHPTGIHVGYQRKCSLKKQKTLRKVMDTFDWSFFVEILDAFIQQKKTLINIGIETFDILFDSMHLMVSLKVYLEGIILKIFHLQYLFI